MGEHACRLQHNTVFVCGIQIGSTILAQAAGVPTLAWSGSGVAISFEDCHGDIPKDIYDKVSSCFACNICSSVVLQL